MPRAREGVPTPIDYDTHAADEQSGHTRRWWQRVPQVPFLLRRRRSCVYVSFDSTTVLHVVDNCVCRSVFRFSIVFSWEEGSADVGVKLTSVTSCSLPSVRTPPRRDRAGRRQRACAFWEECWRCLQLCAVRASRHELP